MVKKILVLGMALVMLFLFAGCNLYPIEKFNSLAEMQVAFPKDCYYFDFVQEGIKEAGKYELTKTSKDGGYIRYSVWYDVAYEIDGQKQKRRVKVVAAYYIYPISDKRISVVDIEDYFYYLVLERGQQKLNEKEIKYFISIFELAIEGKYQIS